MTAVATNTCTVYHVPGYSSKVGILVFLRKLTHSEIKGLAQYYITCKQQSWDKIGPLWLTWVVTIWYWSTENNKEWDRRLEINHGGRRRGDKRNCLSSRQKYHKQIDPAFCHSFVRLLKCCVGKGRNEKRFEKLLILFWVLLLGLD